MTIRCTHTPEREQGFAGRFDTSARKNPKAIDPRRRSQRRTGDERYSISAFGRTTAADSESVWKGFREGWRPSPWSPLQPYGWVRSPRDCSPESTTAGFPSHSQSNPTTWPARCLGHTLTGSKPSLKKRFGLLKSQSAAIPLASSGPIHPRSMSRVSAWAMLSRATSRCPAAYSMESP